MTGYFLLTLLFLKAISANVIELTDQDFDSTLEESGTALVMFYAPWCGHCKRLKPDFEKAGGILASHDPKITLAKVDCTEAGKDTCNRFEVRGYPTLKIFKNGELSNDYSGSRDLNGIVKTMKSQVGPASVELADEAALKKILQKDEVVIINYIDDKSEQETFLKVADKLRESVAFGHFEGSKDKKGVFLYRPNILQTRLEPSELKFEEKFTKDKLVNWIQDNYHGLVGHRSLDNMKDFKSPIVVAYYGVDYIKNPKGTNYWRNRIMKVAKDYPKLNYAISNKDDFLQELEEFGIGSFEADKPKVAIRDGKSKYVMQEDFTVEAFKKFLTAYEKGEVEPHLKSEEVPDNSANAVKVAVAKNFDDLVQKSEKDVLIEFYAPWCGHCKKLAPVYDELGEKMTNENVEIVKMDATANDVPSEFNVQGFPTLYWLPKNTKKPVAYNGGREVDDFIKYIAENASEELKGYNRKGKAKKSEL